MFEELEIVALQRPLEEHHLRAGDVGTVVHQYEQGRSYEVEFVNHATGQTIALLTLTADDLHPVRGETVLYVRELAA